MNARCCQCKKLKSRDFPMFKVPGELKQPGKVDNLGYRCSVGRYDHSKRLDGSLIPQYYAWGGIVRPNKTVAAAQKDCEAFEEGGTPRA